MSTPPPFTFRAKLHHPWDGDTIWLTMERGEGWQNDNKYRLYGVDTPEIRNCSEEEKQYGLQAKAFVQEFLEGKVLTVSTHKGRSKYDWLAEIWVEGHHLARTLIERGHGVEYTGGKKLPWEIRKELQDGMRELYDNQTV